eukprot:tig00001030_g6473.t1
MHPRGPAAAANEVHERAEASGVTGGNRVVGALQACFAGVIPTHLPRAAERTAVSGRSDPVNLRQKLFGTCATTAQIALRIRHTAPTL